MTRSRKLGGFGLVAGALVMLVGSAGATVDESLSVVATISPNNAKMSSFDIGFVDSAVSAYILADRTQNAVHLINTQNNTLVRELGQNAFVGVGASSDTSGPDGVLIVNRHKEVWAGDGNSTFKVLDIGSGAVVGTFSTGGTKRVDEMCTDGTVVAMTNNADSPPFTSIWNIRSKTRVATIFWDSRGLGTGKAATDGAEQCQWDARQNSFFIAIPEVNGDGTNSADGAFVQFNSAGQVLNVYDVPLASCVGPQGMAVGPSPQVLLGCAGSPTNQNTVVMNDTNGAVYATIANEAGNDMVDYDPTTDHYHLARGNACQTSACGSTETARVGLVDASTDTADSDFVVGPRRSSDHSVASDPVTNNVYVPVPGGKSTGLCPSDANGCILVLRAGPGDGDE